MRFQPHHLTNKVNREVKMDDNISEKPKRRGSFLDFLPSNDLPTVNEIPVHRTSFLEGNEPTKKTKNQNKFRRLNLRKLSGVHLLMVLLLNRKLKKMQPHI